MSRYQGECLCGACRYTITGQTSMAMYLCHCSRCRKETGSAHGATAFFHNAELLWEKGSHDICHFKLKHTRKERSFCKYCGSPLPRLEEGGGVVLPVGTLDDDTLVVPTAHIFYQSRASWEDKIRDLRTFDELPE